MDQISQKVLGLLIGLQELRWDVNKGYGIDVAAKGWMKEADVLIAMLGKEVENELKVPDLFV